MNAIDYVLNEIRLKVPKAIRHYAFITLNPQTHYVTVSEDSVIRHRVLDNKVLIDCNLLGGEEVIIPFENVPFKEMDNGKVLYRIPKDNLQGRRIMSALSVSTGDHRLDTYSNSYYPTSTLLDSIGKLLDSHISNGGMTTNRVKLIGENIILLEDRLTFNQLYLRCVLSNDRGLSNFSPRAYPNLAHASVLACKAIIYNDTILEIDASQLMAGVSIGRFKEVIDSYSECDTLYDEYIKTTFTKVLMQQDKEAHSRHLRLLTNGLN